MNYQIHFIKLLTANAPVKLRNNKDTIEHAINFFCESIINSPAAPTVFATVVFAYLLNCNVLDILCP